MDLLMEYIIVYGVSEAGFTSHAYVGHMKRIIQANHKCRWPNQSNVDQWPCSSGIGFETYLPRTTWGAKSLSTVYEKRSMPNALSRKLSVSIAHFTDNGTPFYARSDDVCFLVCCFFITVIWFFKLGESKEKNVKTDHRLYAMPRIHMCIHTYVTHYY